MEILSALGNIGFDWRLALANLVNFLIVFYLLKRFIWAPLRLRIEAREEEIVKGLEDARKAETALMMAEEKKSSILNEAKEERAALLKEARLNAEHTIAQATKDAQDKSQEILEATKKRAIELEEQALLAVREKAVELAISGARAVLREEVNEERSEKLIHSMLKKV